MKPTAWPGHCRPSRHWAAVAGMALIAALLGGCGGDDGAQGAPGATGPAGAAGPAGSDGKDLTAAVQVPGNAAAPSGAFAATWAALAPQVTVTSVTINSKPVVKFSVKDAQGNPVVGLGSKSKSATATVATMPNIAFTLAKLVPATTTTSAGLTFSNEPSKWVSYLVVRPPTVAEKAAVPNASLCDAAKDATWCGTYPATDSQGELKDNGDGTYEYTFYRDVTAVASIVAGLPAASKDGLAKKSDLGDLSYSAALTHRLGIQIGGNAPGTGSNTPNGVTVTPSVAMGTPANAVFDFRPDGGTIANTRDVVALDSCSSCHAGKVLAHGSRKDPNYCVTCHTDQIRYSFSQEASSTNGGLILTGTTRQTTAVVNGRALGDFPNLIHKFHMGEELVKTGYNYNGESQFNHVTYPQPQSNCVMCHDGSATAPRKTANGDNWKNAPSLLACGACHDGIDFATGKGATLADKAKDHAEGRPVGTTQTGHIGGAKADNSTCAMCHDARTTPVDHVTVDPTGSSGRAGYPANTAANVPTPGYPSGQGPSIPLASQLNLPAGVYKIGLEIKSAAVSGVSPRKATVVYRILKDGQPVTLNATGYLIDNVDGTPSIYVAYGIPADGVATPVDWNASINASVKDIRDAKNGNSQTGPDADGWYTATLGAAIPDTAKMVTAGLGLNYQGFVQLNHSAYPKGIRLREPMFAIRTATGTDTTGAANTARRTVVSGDKCNACHGQLGVWPSFHGGARNNGAGCSFCHLPDTATGHVGASYSFGGGWSVSAKNMVHAIHASAMREQAFSYEASAANPGGFAEVTYPGVLNQCEQCHVAGSYDFRTAANNAAVPNLLWTTDAKGNMTNDATTNPNGIASIGLSPWVTALGRGQIDYRTDNLVSSPIASSCFGCHDSKYAIGHMRQNGGTLVTLASTVTATGTGSRASGYNPNAWEGCMSCHGPDKVADIKKVHMK